VNWDRIENDWTHYRADVKAQWAKLDDGKLEALKGHREHLASLIELTYGITRKEAGKQLYDWQKLLKDPVPTA